MNKITLPRLLWTARILMLASAAVILIASYYFYQPRNFPLGMQVSAQVGQTLLYGGLILAIAGFTWLWPGSGGIIVILYGILKFFDLRRAPETPLTLIPAPAYYVLYSIFIIGGILSLVVDLRQKKAPYPETATDKRLRWIARIMALASIVTFIIAYIFIYPPLVFFTIPALFIVGIAWFWPAPGGILMLLISIPDFYPLYKVGWNFQWKWPIYVLLLVFIASGFMHLIMARRRGKLRMNK